MSLSGLDIVTLPDDDKRWREWGTPAGCYAMSWHRVYVRESDWPRLRDALLKATEPAGKPETLIPFRGYEDRRK